MREQNSIPNEYPEMWDDGTYQTGASKPKKGHSVIITVLLMAVIFLGGLASALGVMNVRLLSQLVEQQGAVVPLSMDGGQIAVRGNAPYSIQTPDTGDPAQQLGFQVQELSSFYRRYWDLTAGLEVIDVTDESCQLQEGDIIFSVNGEELTTISQLYDAISSAQTGALKLEILRGRQSFTLELTVESKP